MATFSMASARPGQSVPVGVGHIKLVEDHQDGIARGSAWLRTHAPIAFVATADSRCFCQAAGQLLRLHARNSEPKSVLLSFLVVWLRPGERCRPYLINAFADVATA